MVSGGSASEPPTTHYALQQALWRAPKSSSCLTAVFPPADVPQLPPSRRKRPRTDAEAVRIDDGPLDDLFNQARNNMDGLEVGLCLDALLHLAQLSFQAGGFTM